MRVVFNLAVALGITVNSGWLFFALIRSTDPSMATVEDATADPKTLMFKVLFSLGLYLGESYKLISLRTAALIWGNLTTFAWLRVCFTTNREYLVLSFEVYKMCYSLFESDVIKDSLYLGVLLQIKHAVLWYGLCFYFGVFDDVHSGHMVVTVVLAVSKFQLLLAYKKRQEAKNVRETFESLSQLKQNVEDIFDSIPDPILVVNRHLEILKANRAAQTLTQSRPGFIGETVMQPQHNSPPNEHFSLEDAITELAEAGETEQRTLGIAKIEESLFEVKGVRREDTVTLVLRDVTVLIQLEQSRHESQMKNVMLRSVSHELRTPANSFQNLVSTVLGRTDLPGEVRHLLEMAWDNSKLILHVINDLLDYSQFINGSFRLGRVKFNLRQTLSNSFRPFEYMMRSSGLTGSLTVDEALPQICFNDPNRLSQVVMNLLSNAVKFTRSGGIRVTAVRETDKLMLVSVADDGVGISQAKQACLFSLFGRLQENESLNPEGCGLGLHISTLLARQLGGNSMEIESEEGRGSKFFFRVSLMDEDESEFSDYARDTNETEERDVVSRPTIPSFALPPVLIVDDNAFNRDILGAILSGLTVPSDTARSGADAIDMILTRQDDPYKLVFLDFDMPELNGPETALRLADMKERGALRAVPPLAAYTAYTSDSDRQICLDSGMDCFITKPCPFSELEAVVVRYLCPHSSTS
jgi:signal transduction histidine kinase/CheY-like chemotaxis protein